MTIPNPPCSFQYFPSGNGNLVSQSQQFVNMGSKFGNVYFVNDTIERPFIPYAGMVAGMDGVVFPDTVANHQTFKNAFPQWFTAAWFASNNYVNSFTAGLDQIQNPADNYFASYLNKRLASGTNQVRFMQIPALIWDFWTNADPAWTLPQYQAALQNFVTYLIANASRDLYLAPAAYRFTDTAPTPQDSGLGATVKAWKTASASFVGFMCIEIALL